MLMTEALGSLPILRSHCIRMAILKDAKTGETFKVKKCKYCGQEPALVYPWDNMAQRIDDTLLGFKLTVTDNQRQADSTTLRVKVKEQDAESINKDAKGSTNSNGDTDNEED